MHVGRLNTIPAQKAVRWDREFFRKKFTEFDNAGVAKVYICGPPILQEFFDREVMARNDWTTEFHAL